MSSQQQSTSGQQLANDFKHWVNFKKHRVGKLRYSLLKKLSKKSLPLFFRGGDIISLDPVANGVYEPDIKALIEHFADQGFNDFLLDIGANIGLTSCQSGMKFGEVHMFEPNPNCLSILKINSKIALRQVNYSIHEFGLGMADERMQLHVPFDNWGGAFVASKENEYDADLLSAKDGYGQFNDRNYEVLEVQIKAASKVLSELFDSLIAKGLTKGVIKVDAEGYEKFIINSILASKPKTIEFAIVFENWKDGVEVDEYFTEPCLAQALYKLESNKVQLAMAPRWMNSLLNFLRGGFPLVLKRVAGKLSGGTYLLIAPS